ncbi:MAG TPA: SpoIIE family protein phosphatase [Pyrinomonadaceae bacterium]
MRFNPRQFQALSSALFCCAALALVFFGSARAQTGAAVFDLNAAELTGEKSIELDKTAWKYAPGDDAARAAKDFDDSGWKTITNKEINADPSAALGNWNGKAWFRLRVRVDERLINQPLALRMWHWGASETYLDGALVQSYGIIKPDGEEEQYNPRGLFVPVVFTSVGEHTIAVRYSFSAASDLTEGRGRWLTGGGFMPGFLLTISEARNAARRIEDRALGVRLDYVFVGLLFAFAFAHFLLYVFYRRERGNLYYSFFVAGLAVTILFNRVINDSHFSAMTAAVLDVVRQATQAVALMSLLAFLYVEFVGRVSRFYWALLVLWIVCIGLIAARISLPFPSMLVMLAVTLIDSVRVLVGALARKKAGAWNIAAGVAVLIVGVASNIAFERDVHFLPDWLHNINLYLTILSVPLAVSIYLARNFARTNVDLQTQLAQVRELSAKQLEHERTEAELRLAHERTQAENERRAKELEEARQLQLSMLPKKLPALPNLEIAAYMKPATEVGGDYYDFYLADDGTLTVAVGDATGHGLKAGSVVTATKSLFNAFAAEPDIPLIFDKISRALKKMNLRGLFMAMAMLKIKDNRVSICLAGMPSALIYRRATKEIEEIALRAMPLGGVAKFPYQQQEITLAVGDAMVLMSDGFPEMFNEAGEMIGDETAAVVLRESASESAREIINRFVSAGEKWAGARPADDDVTFVVLKITSAENQSSQNN